MRFFFLLFLTALLSYFALIVMPWWLPMLISFALVLLFPVKSRSAFLSTAIGAAICYFFITCLADQANEHILSRKMAVLFHLPSYTLLIVITTLMGFLTAGLGGWTAAALHKLFRPAQKAESDQIVGDKRSSHS